MTTTELTEIGGRLRHAIAIRDFDHAPMLVAEYREGFDRIWESLGEEDRADSALPEQALELMQWARVMTIAAKREMMDARSGAQAASRYTGRQTMMMRRYTA